VRTDLRRCEDEGPDGTRLGGARKLYLPLGVAVGGQPFGLVLLPALADDEWYSPISASVCATSREAREPRRSTPSPTDGCTGAGRRRTRPGRGCERRARGQVVLAQGTMRPTSTTRLGHRRQEELIPPSPCPPRASSGWAPPFTGGCTGGGKLHAPRRGAGYGALRLDPAGPSAPPRG
jgi:hypothetical protein